MKEWRCAMRGATNEPRWRRRPAEGLGADSLVFKRPSEDKDGSCLGLQIGSTISPLSGRAGDARLLPRFRSFMYKAETADKQAHSHSREREALTRDPNVSFNRHKEGRRGGRTGGRGHWQTPQTHRRWSFSW